ncbi:hypothetical protein BWI93_27280 [Siphonobacter sp. BAB-5385]|uniref:hypothetical protein n=1 Tax=Siphonobacter sp. BAB-5385 TaxID=1864822 RepID=UPI000B9E4581|nr:hypothetical protein [Siphonobacter sp. BAB-5385]OZI05092.1 hypothetical protein BWI93_27280 [Siphonobacter sp. BAB-5385]
MSIHLNNKFIYYLYFLIKFQILASTIGKLFVTMSIVVLEDFSRVSSLTPGYCSHMAESAAHCLYSQGHASGISLAVSNQDGDTSLELKWNIPNDERLNKTYRDRKKTTDFGAMAITVHMVCEYTPFDEILLSETGDGVDMWLSNTNESFGLGARLEISGILKETQTNKPQYRLSVKKKQTEASDSTNIPAYVSIVEFSKPAAIFIKK